MLKILYERSVVIVKLNYQEIEHDLLLFLEKQIYHCAVPDHICRQISSVQDANLLHSMYLDLVTQVKRQRSDVQDYLQRMLVS